MEKNPKWLRAAIGGIAFLFLPAIGYIYSQGQSNQVNEYLAASNAELVDSIKGLTMQVAALNEKLSTEMVKIDYNERRIGKLEDKVLYNSHSIATMKVKGDNNG